MDDEQKRYLKYGNNDISKMFDYCRFQHYPKCLIKACWETGLSDGDYVGVKLCLNVW